MTDIRMPDGKVVRFPDDMPREKIRALIEAKYPDAVKGVKAPAPAPDDEWETPRGDFNVPIISDITRSLYPLQENTKTGERRLAVPTLITDAMGGMESVTKAATGQYGMQVDPETGRATPVTDEMMSDAMTGASLAAPTLRGGVLRVGPQLPKMAEKNLRRAFALDKIDPAQAPAMLQALGPDAVPGDLGPALKAQTQAVSAMPGPGQRDIVDTLTARKDGRNARIIGEVDETLGPAPIPSRLAAENLTNKKALGPEYDASFANASAVDTSQIALDMDTQIVNLRGEAQAALKKVRDMLNVTGTKDQLDPNPRTLFEVRNAIDGMLETEANSKVVGTLSNIRAQIDTELAAKVPRIKQVDAKFEELARQGQAVDKGQTLLDSGRTATRPEELADTFAPSAVPERGMGPSAVPFRLTQGARAEIERIIKTTGNDLTALQTALKGDGSWNRDRLAQLFGPEKADQVLGILEREKTYASTEGPALGGARTAVLDEAAQELVKPAKKPGFFQNALNFNGGSALAALGDSAFGWVGTGRRDAAAAAMGDYLSSNAGSNMLRALPPKAGGGVVKAVDNTARAVPSITLRELLINDGRPKPGQISM